MLECKQLFQTNPGAKCYRKVPRFSSCKLLVPVLFNKTQLEIILAEIKFSGLSIEGHSGKVVAQLFQAS